MIIVYFNLYICKNIFFSLYVLAHIFVEYLTFTGSHASPFKFVLILNSQNKIIWQTKSFSPPAPPPPFSLTNEATKVHSC